MWSMRSEALGTSKQLDGARVQALGNKASKLVKQSDAFRRAQVLSSPCGGRISPLDLPNAHEAFCDLLRELQEPLFVRQRACAQRSKVKES